jgi:hypothetical protein
MAKKRQPMHKLEEPAERVTRSPRQEKVDNNLPPPAENLPPTDNNMPQFDKLPNHETGATPVPLSEVASVGQKNPNNVTGQGKRTSVDLADALTMVLYLVSKGYKDIDKAAIDDLEARFGARATALLDMTPLDILGSVTIRGLIQLGNLIPEPRK